MVQVGLSGPRPTTRLARRPTDGLQTAYRRPAEGRGGAVRIL